MIIALLTKGEIIQLCEIILIGGFSCVKMRVDFNTEILVSNLLYKDFSKLNIDDSFKKQKSTNFKVSYRMQLKNEETYSDQGIVSKILQMDENNHYGQAMTKPLSTGCIKEKKRSLHGKSSKN